MVTVGLLFFGPRTKWSLVCPSSVPRLNTGTKWSLFFWRDSGGIQAHGCTITPSLIINSIIDHGPYQANRTQIHRRQGPTQTARHQGSSQVCPGQDEDDTRIDETTMSNVTTRTTTTRTGTQQRGCEDEDDTRIDGTTDWSCGGAVVVSGSAA